MTFLLCWMKCWIGLTRPLCKDDFKYLSQEFDNNVLDLVKQMGFYPYEYMSDFETFKEEFLLKEGFIAR